jgi:hypothetical protein
MVTAGLALAACGGASSEAVSLEAELAQARKTALAAAIIGSAGGELAVSAGEYAGTLLSVPPGAVRADAVFSLSAAKQIAADTGYTPVGPMLRVASSATVLQDLTLVIPYNRALVAEYAVLPLFLKRAEGLLAPVGGALFEAGLGRAAIRPPGDYGVAIDPDGDNIEEKPAYETRCPLLTGVTGLAGAIQSTGTQARFVLSSPSVITAETVTTADSCGRSSSWQVGWYSRSSGSGIVVSWESNTSQQVAAITSLPAFCETHFAPAQFTVDTPELTDDLIESSGVEPVALWVRILSCFDGYSTPRVRIDDNDSALWVEYTPDGQRVAQSY